MAEAAAAWGEVASSFGGLGQKLRHHFEQARTGDPSATSPSPAAGGPDSGTDAGSTPPPSGGDAAAGASGTAGDTSGGGVDDQVRAAVRKLAEAIDDVVDAVGAAVKDPAVKDDVRKVGGALSEALSASFAEVSDDLRRAFRRGDQTTPDRSTPDPSPTAEKGPTATPNEPSGE